MAVALKPNAVIEEAKDEEHIPSSTSVPRPTRMAGGENCDGMDGLVDIVDPRADEQEKQRFESINGLLFPDDEDVEYSDDWNKRFQKALDLPEETEEDCYQKWQKLTAVNRDFVATAVTYGKTIISEYFLPDSDKSIHRNWKVGGQAGGKKFLWRGILFKLADGSTGPYYGNDEAAAKGAGHDLRGATHYLGTRIKTLHYALQCLIDYLGFRMTAQAELPVDATTLRYGTADAAKTVHNMDPELERKLKAAAKKLNLRTHLVGGKEMHSACDIEGHKGKDSRHYLLDFARSFPPESPFKVDHLSTILNNGTPVHVDLRGFIASGGVDGREGGRWPQFWGREEENKKVPGVITKAYVPLDKRDLSEENVEYLVKLKVGVQVKVPSSLVKDRHLCIYWRMLRPEFVKTFGESQKEEDEGTDASQTPRTVNTPATATPVRRFTNFNRLPPTMPNLETIFSEASHDGSVVSVRMSRDISLRVPALDPMPESPVAGEGLGDGNGGGGYTGYDSESEDLTSTDELSPPDLRQLSNAGWRTPFYGERRQEQKEDNNEGESGGRRNTRRRAGISREGAMRRLSHPDSPSLPRSLDRLPMIPGSDAFDVDTIGPSEWGCTRYQVFSSFNKKSQREEGLKPYNRESSRKLIRSFNNSPSFRSIHMSTSIRVPRGDGTLFHGGGSRGCKYEVLEPTGRRQHPWAMGFLSRRDLSVGSGSVGGGAGGASGRAGPRTIFVEGTGSSGNLSLSYRFYPEEGQEETKHEEECDATGNGCYMRGDATAGLCLGRRGVGRGMGEDNRSERWGLIPLSPDALSGFSKEDPEVFDRNQEVHDATGMLIENVIPNLAEQLETMEKYDQETLDLGIEMHRHGVNIRHLGKLRAIVEERNCVLKEMILTEMVARTLKNILRFYQRQWMKAKRSTSDQGMRRLVVNFLNLVTGAHDNHKDFWEKEVTVGLLQRFGLCALSQYERIHLEDVCTNNACVLKACVGKLVEMQGLTMFPAAEKFFEDDANPKGFGFVVADIQEIRPIVRYMHILDYGGGVMLSMQAKKREQVKGSRDRIVQRLNWQAMQHFRTAFQSMPNDQATRTALLSYSTSKFKDLQTPRGNVSSCPTVQASPPPIPCDMEPIPLPIIDPGTHFTESIAKRFCRCFCGISGIGRVLLRTPRPKPVDGPLRIAPRVSINSYPSESSSEGRPLPDPPRPEEERGIPPDLGTPPMHCPGHMSHL